MIDAICVECDKNKAKGWSCSYRANGIVDQCPRVKDNLDIIRKLRRELIEINNKSFNKKTVLIMNFGEVIEALKAGKSVQRVGWNGKGMYIWLLPRNEVKKEWVRDPLLAKAFGDKDTLECGECIRMKNAVGTVDTWHPSIPDLFAEDWQIVE